MKVGERMIIGVGVDLVEIVRLKNLLKRPSAERFLQRILTPAERNTAQERAARLAEFVAGRFAAKEAVVKAFGCGIGEMMGFQDMEVLSDALGKPVCTVSATALQRLRVEPNVRIHLSITHTGRLAAAYVVIESSAHPTTISATNLS